MRRLPNLRFLAVTAAVLGIAGGFTPARAQDQDDLKRGVARISVMNGDVSVRRGDSGDWVAGVINAPMLTGDNLGTGPNSRAEVQFDAANLLRLGANGDLRLTQLEYGRTQLQLAKGIMTYRVLRASENNVEIDTPSLSVRPAREGSFRLSVNDAGETEVTARGGDVEVFTPHGSQWVRNGQTLLARGAATDAEFQVVAAGGMDEWDRWCDGRDRLITQSSSSRYVGQGVYGTEDLDAAGTWSNVPEYGNVWHPTTVGADWAPYQAGRWVWEDWYGWTWVSADPWGWAPYHYGRWFRDGRLGWCWYPGVIGVRSYWSPALVGFFGFGGRVGVGVGFGFGNVGWVALAPFEVFHPWWGRGFYGGGGFNNRSLNITNINVTNVYRNSRFANGVHSVAAADFQGGRFNNVNRMSGSQIQGAGAINGRMPFTPGAQNMRFSDRQVGSVPRTNSNAQFFTHQTPNPVGRTSTGQSGVGQAGAGQAGAVRGQGPAAGGQSPSGTRSQAMGQSGGDNGWRRFGTPAGQPAGAAAGQATRNDRPAANSQGGWQRFGSTGQGSTGQGSAGQGPASNQNGGRQFGTSSGSGSAQQSVRIAPQVVRPRTSGQTYGTPSAPRQSAPAYSAPRQSAPSNSAPRSNGGGGQPSGGGGSRPSGSGGGNKGGHGR
jgi:FecR protein